MHGRKELVNLGLIPKTGYTLGKRLPSGWRLPKSVPHSDFKYIPLYLQVHYDKNVNEVGEHSLIGQLQY